METVLGSYEIIYRRTWEKPRNIWVNTIGIHAGILTRYAQSTKQRPYTPLTFFDRIR